MRPRSRVSVWELHVATRAINNYLTKNKIRATMISNNELRIETIRGAIFLGVTGTQKVALLGQQFKATDGLLSAQAWGRKGGCPLSLSLTDPDSLERLVYLVGVCCESSSCEECATRRNESLWE